MTDFNTDLTVLNDKSIIFVGGGNMSSALIDGLINAKRTKNISIDIRVSDRNQPKLDEFTKKGVTSVLSSDADELICTSDIVVLAVKPQVMADVCKSIKPALGHGQLIISVAAGLGMDKLYAMTGSDRVVRTMPNLPSTVGFGATGLFGKVAQSDKDLAAAVMAASGIAVWVDDESDLHAVTAVAGSAPAYFFYMLEQMVDKAVQMGLDKDKALALATQTMQGAAVMATNANPSELKQKVMSKGGTTFAAISSMEQNGVGKCIQHAMQACADRSIELSQS
ncbi:pyrroline-5-carboxylate reductase [Moraxella nasovis]|uniref:pyrroline-5-carboxylate reductase n=1 Tax=Moraxella nasovis TaxID=2904121 RepID=UPI001F61435C|nr:pyrroline-5-carboxylate reductase [Moraxella nasovis]UNU73931.1 pyrroline-5-carboxylate reductase [Moraxella nasovis]